VTVASGHTLNTGQSQFPAPPGWARWLGSAPTTDAYPLAEVPSADPLLAAWSPATVSRVRSTHERPADV
jgi:hypothetical protein